MADVKNVVDFEYRVSGAGQAAAGMDKMAGSGIIVANMAIQLARELGQVAARVKAVFDETVALSSALYDGASAASMDVESYQALDFMLQQSGGSAGDAANAMRALTAALASGSEEASTKREALEALGLSYEAIMDMAPEDAFITIADALKTVTDAQERNVAAAEIFGARFSQATVRALNQTTGSIRENVDAFLESNLVISGETVAAYEAFGDAQGRLTQRMNVMKAEGLLPLIPLQEELMRTIEDLAEDAIPEITEAIANWAFGLEKLIELTAYFNDDDKGLPVWIQTVATVIQNAQNPLVFFNTALGWIRESAEDARPPVTDLTTIMDIHAAVLANLNREEVLAAHAAYVFAESNLVILASMSGFSSAFDEQIQRVRDMRTEMEAVAITLTGTTVDVTATRRTPGSGTRQTQNTEEEEAQRLLLELERERLEVKTEMVQRSREMAEFELQMQEQQIELDGRRKEEQLAAYQERMAPILSAAQQTTDILVSGLIRGFDNIGDQFQGMLKQMAADYLKSQIMRLLFNVGKKGFFLL